MAKQDFTVDPVLTPTHENLLYRTNGGHKHDDVDADGHAARINLSSGSDIEVAGILPYTMYVPLPGYIHQFITSRPSAQRITFGAGRCLDRTFTQIIQRNVTISKDINAAWAAGNNNGGYGGGSALASEKFYYLFVIEKDDAVDAGFDDDPTGANLLSASGYNYCRRVGAIYYNATPEIEDYRQLSDFFLYKAVRSESVNLNGASGGFLSTAKDMIPPKIHKSAIVGSSAPTLNGVYGILYVSGFTAAAVPTGAASENLHDVGSNASGVKTSVAHKRVTPDVPSGAASGRVLWELNTDPASGSITAYCWGWIDYRGRDGLD